MTKRLLVGCMVLLMSLFLFACNPMTGFYNNITYYSPEPTPRALELGSVAEMTRIQLESVTEITVVSVEAMEPDAVVISYEAEGDTPGEMEVSQIASAVASVVQLNDTPLAMVTIVPVVDAEEGTSVELSVDTINAWYNGELSGEDFMMAWMPS